MPELKSKEAAWLGLVWLAGGGAVTWTLTALAAELTQPGSIAVFVAVIVTPMVVALLAWYFHRSLQVFLWVAIWCGVAQALGFIFLLAMFALIYFSGVDFHH